MPRKRVDLSSLINETQKYNKVTQEDEQVISTPVEQETVKTEKQISVDTDKHTAVTPEIQKPVSADMQKGTTTEEQRPITTDLQKSVNTEVQTPVNMPIQKSVSAESERTHKQTIVISEDLAFRLKVHAARRKETIASIATRAFEKLLAEEENI